MGNTYHQDFKNSEINHKSIVLHEHVIFVCFIANDYAIRWDIYPSENRSERHYSRFYRILRGDYMGRSEQLYPVQTFDNVVEYSTNPDDWNNFTDKR